MTDPFYKANPGDPIFADDWNNMQGKMRDEITTKVNEHSHSGDFGQGPKLLGNAIDSSAVVALRQLSASVSLSVTSSAASPSAIKILNTGVQANGDGTNQDIFMVPKGTGGLRIATGDLKVGLALSTSGTGTCTIGAFSDSSIANQDIVLAPKGTGAVSVNSGLSVASASANADITLNSQTRPTIYPKGSNLPSSGNLGLQVRSAGTGLLQLNADNAGDVSIATGGGKIGIGVAASTYRLEVAGMTRLNNDANQILFSSSWQGFPDNSTSRAEICNDTGTYKTLMIVGNKSDGGSRSVSVWDRLNVNGILTVNGLYAVVDREERVRIIRGWVLAGFGGAGSGAGWSVNRAAQGIYDITFSVPFNDTPAVTATQIYPGNGDLNSGGGSTLDNAVVVGVQNWRVRIKTGDGGGNASDRSFAFIAVGL